MKPSTKFILFCSLLVTLTCVVMAWLAYSSISNTLVAKVLDRFRERSTNRMLSIDNMLHYNLVNTQVIAGDPLFCTPAPPAQKVAARLISYRNLFKIYLSISYFSNDGVLLADTSGLGIGQPVDPQSPPGKHWPQVLDGTFTHGAGHSRLLNADLIYVTRPVICPDEPKLRGAIVARINIWRLHALFPIAASGSESVAVHIDLFDDEGLLLYSNHHRTGIMKVFSDSQMTPEGKNIEVLANEDQIVSVARSMGTMDFKGSNWLLRFSVAREAAREEARILGLRIAITSLFIIAAATVLAYFFARRFVRPMMHHDPPK
ncbi:MAG: cache domain-containing protein [Magnetococcales bacterium]|nr:cache domain-containing protein [Magnetococcales bacterium]MBF0150797.1 cache domain-containing protein [Magnetococcales bacterium]